MDTSTAPSYRGYRFPREIIAHCVWLYFRFNLSFRDIQEMMLERDVDVSYEAIRLWCLRFGTEYARRLRRRGGRPGGTWHGTVKLGPRRRGKRHAFSRTSHGILLCHIEIVVVPVIPVISDHCENRLVIHVR
jgi:hypothetical protein